MNITVIDNYIEKLNPEQKSAAKFDQGSVLVLAAAGSGKTSTLTSRIAYLIAHKNIAPNHIMAVTFTNKAAKEMINRLDKMGIDTKSLWIGTFHGICNKILRYHAVDAGIKKNFYIMDQQEQLSFLKRICRSNGYDPKVVNIPQLQNNINGYKEVGWRSSQLQTGTIERKIYELYEKACINDNCVDFAELMLGCYELFTNNPHIADAYADKFQHILIDEFQDTSELQYKWLKILSQKHKNVFAVGDDDQCVVEGSNIDTPKGEVKIEKIKKGDYVLSKIGNLTVPKKVTSVFSESIVNDIVTITLKNGTVLKSKKEHVWFSNRGKDLVNKKSYLVYLEFNSDSESKVCIYNTSSLSESKKLLKNKKNKNIWVLSAHEDLLSASMTRLRYANMFNISILGFDLLSKFLVKPNDPLRAEMEKAKELLGKEKVQNALKLLNKLQGSSEYPFKVKKKEDEVLKIISDLSNKINGKVDEKNIIDITLTLCDKIDNDKAIHSMIIKTENMEIKETLTLLMGMPKIKKKVATFKVYQEDYGVLNGLINDIEYFCEGYKNIEFRVIQKARVTDSKKMYHVMAKDIIPGMFLPDRNNELCEVINVEICKEHVRIYDLNVENTHNYIVNGIVTHNSIYSFRGAEPENLLLFKNEFDAKLIKIEKNYRSNAYVLDAANAIIANNKNRQGKNLVPTKPHGEKINLYTAFNDIQESNYIASEIKRLRRLGISYRNMSILYRTNGQSRSLEKALNSLAIPYIIYGGFRFFDRQEVKHAMAYLRLANNPEDNMAFLRVANTPARAIGDAALKKLDAQAQENNCSLYKMAISADAKTIKKFAPFVEVINKLQALCANQTIPEMVRRVIVHSGLEAMYEKEEKDGEERLDNLYELISAAEVFIAENKKADLDEFLAFSTLETNVETKKKDENADAVKLMTVHASKGLEFDVVFIAGLEEQLFPHANAIGSKDQTMIEEERRLMYVALTRAKELLYLSYCEERLLHGQRESFIRSRFLSEIPKAVLNSIV